MQKFAWPDCFAVIDCVIPKRCFRRDAVSFASSTLQLCQAAHLRQNRPRHRIYEENPWHGLTGSHWDQWCEEKNTFTSGVVGLRLDWFGRGVFRCDKKSPKNVGQRCSFTTWLITWIRFDLIFFWALGFLDAFGQFDLYFLAKSRMKALSWSACQTRLEAGQPPKPKIIVDVNDSYRSQIPSRLEVLLSRLPQMSHTSVEKKNYTWQISSNKIKFQTKDFNHVHDLWFTFHMGWNHKLEWDVQKQKEETTGWKTPITGCCSHCVWLRSIATIAWPQNSWRTPRLQFTEPGMNMEPFADVAYLRFIYAYVG